MAYSRPLLEKWLYWMAPLSMLRAMSIRPVLVPNASLAEHARRGSGYAAILGTICALFAARVAAQAMQRWSPLPFLPPASAFQGSALPYAILLPAQLAILATMLRIVFSFFLPGRAPRGPRSQWRLSPIPCGRRS